MKNKWNWLDQPITWRTSRRLSAWTMVIYGIVYGVFAVWYFWDEIMEKLDSLTSLVKEKLNRD